MTRKMKSTPSARPKLFWNLKNPFENIKPTVNHHDDADEVRTSTPSPIKTGSSPQSFTFTALSQERTSSPRSFTYTGLSQEGNSASVAPSPNNNFSNEISNLRLFRTPSPTNYRPLSVGNNNTSSRNTEVLDQQLSSPDQMTQAVYKSPTTIPRPQVIHSPVKRIASPTVDNNFMKAQELFIKALQEEVAGLKQFVVELEEKNVYIQNSFLNEEMKCEELESMYVTQVSTNELMTQKLNERSLNINGSNGFFLLIIAFLGTERKQMQDTIDHLTFDLNEVQEQSAHQKALNERHEQDFKLFSRKIASLQQKNSQLVGENQELKSTIRQLQYEPREVDGVYKIQLEQSLYDNEALKKQIDESPGPDSLKSHTNLDQFNISHFDNRNELEDTQQIVSYNPEESKSRETWAEVRKTPSKKIINSNQLPGNSPTPKSRTSEQLLNMDFFTRREHLDKTLSDLMGQKQKLVSELAKIPSSGMKSRLRMTEVEELLDEIDLKICATRKTMKNFGVL